MYSIHFINSYMGSSIQVYKKDHSSREGRKEMVYLTMHLTHFIYGYMASDIW